MSAVEQRRSGHENISRRLRRTWCCRHFVIRDGKDWRLVSYEADILSRVPWDEADVTPLFELELSLEEKRDVEIASWPRRGPERVCDAKRARSLSGRCELKI